MAWLLQVAATTRLSVVIGLNEKYKCHESRKVFAVRHETFALTVTKRPIKVITRNGNETVRRSCFFGGSQTHPPVRYLTQVGLIAAMSEQSISRTGRGGAYPPISTSQVNHGQLVVHQWFFIIIIIFFSFLEIVSTDMQSILTVSVVRPLWETAFGWAQSQWNRYEDHMMSSKFLGMEIELLIRFDGWRVLVGSITLRIQ